MSAGIRHDDLRRRNRALVIAAVRRSGMPSRTEIASTTGLSHSTISAISSDLIAEGVLEETKGSEHAMARRGRPQVALALNPEAATVIVAVLSLNDLSAAIIDYSGGVVAQEQRAFSTATMPRDELVAECTAMLQRLMTSMPPAARKPLRIVLAVQGTTDATAREMLWSPITPHRDIAFADVLERELTIPTPSRTTAT